jgi:LAO/AO transport system kinase
VTGAPEATAVQAPAAAAPRGRRGRRQVDVPALVDGARKGDARSVARLISLVEDASPALREVAAALSPHTGHAQVLGLTGAPGVGKSTTTTALVTALRAQGKRVGVLAVDPSSPFSGGALLGDRVRMQDHAGDSGVYIRSMASRGHLGGLSWATPQALRVLDAAGCDVVLVETVGVGQSELEIASLADTTLVLVAPGMGDGIQAAKAGILEVADVFVVNKADREGADQTVRDLRYMLSLGGRHSEAGHWRPPICRTVAARQNDNGIDEVLERIDAHRHWLESSGEGQRRRTERAAREIEAIALATLRERMDDVHGSAALGTLAEKLVAGDTDPYTAADELVGRL